MQRRKIYLLTEYLVFFYGFPLSLFFSRDLRIPAMVLFPVLILILVLLRRSREFRWKELVKVDIDKKNILYHIITIAAVFAILTLCVLVYQPGNFLNLPKSNPRLWILISLFYPVYSVFAQEIIFRTFIYRRYGDVFNKPLLFVIASALSFGFAHILYFSWVSIVLTFLMGLYLSHTYLRTKSIVFTSVIHSLLGDFVFTIGLGHYFWLDMNKWL